MTWDATAQLLAAKVIGTVETGLQWDAVNTQDAITVGIAQWWGERAAAILDRFKNENASSWTGVASTLANDLTAHSSSDTFWETRFLTSDEANSIMPVLRANQSIQTNQLQTDINGYVTIAGNQGMNVNTDTQAFILWATAYHQGPKYAFQVMANVGPNASIDQYLTAILNNPVLGQYPNRYNTAYSMILSGDTSGMTAIPTPTPTTVGGSGGSVGGTVLSGANAYVERVGDHLLIHGTDGSATWAYNNGSGRYIAGATPGVGAAITTPPPVTPTNPPSGSTTTGQALVDWVASEAGAFAYGQGPGRLSPLNAIPPGGNQAGYTDCSGLCYYAYMAVTGKDIGTWGGAQIQNGSLVATGGSTIDTTNLQLGDLIFYEWQGGDPVNYDHTAMYAGNGKVWSHGGGQGPTLIPITGSYTGVTPVAIMARRYI